MREWKMESADHHAGVENAGLENRDQNLRLQRWKIRDSGLKLLNQIAGAENVGLENEIPKWKGGECGVENTGTKLHGWKMWDPPSISSKCCKR